MRNGWEIFRLICNNDWLGVKLLTGIAEHPFSYET